MLTKQSLFLVAIATLLLCGFAPSRAIAATPAIITDTVVIVGANSPGPYFVSGFFIISGSESVVAHSGITSEHFLDANQGRITFTQSLTPADTITVVFQRLGFAFRSHWSREPSTDAPSTSGIIPVSYMAPPTSSVPTLRSLTTPTRLQWQGHKSFAVTASDGRNTDWSQGMELGVEGELAQGLRLSAALSDRQVGRGSRYGSQGESRLGDLDRFFIEAQSQKFYGRWGELRLEGRGGASRRVAGLQTRLTTNRHSLESFIARPQGETRRAEIALREGVLGPYTLSGSSAHANIVDGSQTVWLAGKRLAEGADGDFTIDPARGTVTLSPRVPFSRQDQLIVEYEESLDDYQRTMAGGAWGWRSADSSLHQSLAFAWEGDDPSQPLFGSLSDEQRDILGSSPSGVVNISAAERVGELDGDYTLSVSASGDSVFAYAGPDQGDWDVRFQWVGDGEGNYRHLIDNVFEYTGDGRGSYSANLSLNAPAAEAVINESLHLTTRRLGSIGLDWQGIALDPNRFSSGSSRAHSNHNIGWSLGNSRNSQSSFASVNWIRQSQRAATHDIGLALSQFSGAWRLSADRLDQSYDSYQISSALAATSWFLIRSDAERFESSRLGGWRSVSSAQIRPNHWLSLEQQLQQRWVTASGANDGRTLQLQSRIRAEAESYAAEAGLKTEDIDDPSRQFTFETDANVARWLTVTHNSFTVRQEWRRSHDLDLNRTERISESSVGIPLNLLGASSGSVLTAVRGNRSLADDDAQPYYGGRLHGTWNVHADLQVSAELDLSHRNAGLQREVFIPTRPGQGDYRFERGEYIPDPQGDYRRVFVDDEDGDASAYDAQKNFRLNWRPPWHGWRWSIDASRRVDSRFASSDFEPGTWLLPWTELSSWLLPGGRLTLRDDHRISVMPRSQSRATLLITQEHQVFRSSDSNSDDNQRVWRIETEWREELTARSYISATAQYHRRTRDGSVLSSIDSDARALLTAIGFTPTRGVGVSIEARRRLDREFEDSQMLSLWGVRPSSRVSTGSLSGSLSTDFTWLGGDEPDYLSPLLAEGRPYGFSFTESVELRWQLPSRISMNARVSGDHRPNEPDRWRMHIETVATF